MLPNWLQKMAKGYTEFVYNKFGKDSGQMLLVTNVIGIALSTLAQSIAVLVNDKYTVSQKAFMIPQDFTEGIASIFSLFLVTLPIQLCAKKYARTGKIATKEMLAYMKKHDLLKKRGNLDFDFGKTISSKITEIENGDTFVKSEKLNKEKILNEHINILNKYNTNLDATSAISTTAGAILTTSLLLPFVRNFSASHFQKLNMRTYDSYRNKHSKQLSTLSDYKIKTYSSSVKV